MHDTNQSSLHSRRSALKLGAVGTVAIGGALTLKSEGRAISQESTPNAASAYQAAKRYVETLSAEQKSIAVLEFQDKKRLE